MATAMILTAIGLFFLSLFFLLGMIHLALNSSGNGGERELGLCEWREFASQISAAGL
jgi:hypothetical protein